MSTGETRDEQRFNVRKVAVLGAGVMGAQIAAHLVNVKVPVILFDLPAKEGPKNGIVTKAIEGLKKLKPAPLGVPEDAALIEQANYEEHLDTARRSATWSSRRSPSAWTGSSTSTRRSRRRSRRTRSSRSNTSGLSITKLVRSAAGRRSSRASAASTSSTRRATWRWSS